MRIFLAVAILCLAIVGCGEDSQNTRAAAPAAPRHATPPAADAATTSIPPEAVMSDPAAAPPN